MAQRPPPEYPGKKKKARLNFAYEYGGATPPSPFGAAAALPPPFGAAAARPPPFGAVAALPPSPFGVPPLALTPKAPGGGGGSAASSAAFPFFPAASASSGNGAAASGGRGGKAASAAATAASLASSGGLGIGASPSGGAAASLLGFADGALALPLAKASRGAASGGGGGGGGGSRASAAAFPFSPAAAASLPPLPGTAAAAALHFGVLPSSAKAPKGAASGGGGGGIGAALPPLPGTAAAAALPSGVPPLASPPLGAAREGAAFMVGVPAALAPSGGWGSGASPFGGAASSGNGAAASGGRGGKAASAAAAAASLAPSGGLGIGAPPSGGAAAPLFAAGAPFGGAASSGSVSAALPSAKAPNGAASGGGGGGSGAAAAPPPCGIAQCHPNHPIHPMTLIQCLALNLADNLHDIADGYRNKTPAEAEQARHALMNTFYRIFDIIRSVVNHQGVVVDLADLAARCRARADVNANIRECLHTLMDDKVTLSNIEDSTIAFFERITDYLHPLLPTSKVTYDEIVGDADDDIIARAQEDRENGSFQILPGTRRSKTLNEEEKRKITLYKNVFFTGSPIAEIFVTFDAGKGAVGHIYEGHEFVRGLNMPQNVGDSATTSFKQLGAQPDLFIAPSDPATPGRFYVKRNILSNDQLRIFYQDDGFCKKFPFRISFGLEAVGAGGGGGAAAAAPVIMSYEQNGYTQGPSLDYLIELMRAAQDEDEPAFTGIETTSLCLRIGDAIQGSPMEAIVRAMLGGVYPDIKLGGDADVPVAALLLLCLSFIDENKYIIAATIDRLCSLVYRLLGIPCIYQNGDELILYNNLRTDRTISAEAKARLLAEKQQAYIDNYSGLVNLYKDGEAQARLLRFICSFRNVIGEELAAAAAHAAAAAPGAPAAARAAAARADTALADATADLTPLEILRRNKYIDIYNRLRNVYTIITRVAGAGVDPVTVIEAINVAPPAAAAAAAAAAPAGDNNDVKARKINKFFDIFSAAQIDKSFLIGLQAILAAPAAGGGAAGGAGAADPAPPAGNSAFDSAIDYGYLNYSVEAFENLVKAYNEFMRIKNPIREPREPENYDNKLNKEDGYNTLLRKYTNTFFDVGHGNAAYEALMFKTPAVAAGAVDPASARRAAIAAYEREAKVVASLIGESAESQRRRRAFGAIKADAVTASQALRGMLTNRVLTRLGATVLPGGCPAQDGGAYQKGGAYSENHVKLFKDICERAATFINSEIGRLYPLAIQRYAVDQFVESLESYMAKGDARRLELINSYNFIDRFIPKSEAAAAAVHPVRQILDSYYPGNIHQTIIELKAGRAADNPIDRSLDLDVTIDNLLLRIPDSRASDMLTELFMIWSEGINGADLDPSYYAISILLDPFSADPVVASATAAAVVAAASAAGSAAASAARSAARSAAAAAAAAAADAAVEKARGEAIAASTAAKAAREAVAAAADQDAARAARLRARNAEKAAEAAIEALNTLILDLNETSTEAPLPAAAEVAAAEPAAAAAEAAIVGSQNDIVYSQLKLSYPLLFTFNPVSRNRQIFLKKLLGSDPVRGIYNRVSLYSLITLAFFDDLFKGNVGNRTSLLISRLGALPAQARGFDIREDNWGRIPEIITSILIQVNNNRISTEGLVLMTGGARSSKYRHTRRRNRRAKRVTRRKD